MEEAFILIVAEHGHMWKVAAEAAKIDGVKAARAVAGRFDVAIHVEVEDLEEVIEKIHSIKGIVRCEILVALGVRYM
jgi:DNA-binding Lrp family transcriptional regulator